MCFPAVIVLPSQESAVMSKLHGYTSAVFSVSFPGLARPLDKAIKKIQGYIIKSDKTDSGRVTNLSQESAVMSKLHGH